MIAARAKRNTIREAASFNKLSPSIMLSKDFGTLTLFMMVVADMASGGETIPPKRKPNANVNPGINAFETKATTQEVMMTTGKAKLAMTLFHFQNSFQETCQAAS